MLGSPYHRIFWKNQNLMYTVEPWLTELWSSETQVKRKSFDINKKAKLTLKYPCNTETMHYRWPLPRAPQVRCLLCGGIDLPETGQLVLLPALLLFHLQHSCHFSCAIQQARDVSLAEVYIFLSSLAFSTVI